MKIYSKCNKNFDIQLIELFYKKEYLQGQVLKQRLASQVL